MFIAATLSCTTEWDALMGIYNANGGASWKNATKWGVDPNQCNWEGVTCNQAKFVIELNLAGQGLVGTLSPSISCLPFLKMLNLDNNQLTSQFIPELCLLQNLQYLHGSKAGFQGALPTCVCTMQHLMYMYLDHNGISDVIPTCVNNMTFLRELHLDCNNLIGTVPTGFNTLQYLTEVRLQCNPSLDCTSALSNKTNFIYVCANADCSACTIIPSNCPLFVEVPNCGRYYPPATPPTPGVLAKKTTQKTMKTMHK